MMLVIIWAFILLRYSKAESSWFKVEAGVEYTKTLDVMVVLYF